MKDERKMTTREKRSASMANKWRNVCVASLRRSSLAEPLDMLCMCSPKGYGFSAVLVINRVSIMANLIRFKWGKGFGNRTAPSHQLILAIPHPAG